MSGYVLADRAAEELDSILEYIAGESGRSRAADVLDEFIQAFEALASTPGMGFQRMRLTGKDIRWWPVFRYLILYRNHDETVQILRVLHSARNLDYILSQPGSL